MPARPGNKREAALISYNSSGLRVSIYSMNDLARQVCHEDPQRCVERGGDAPCLIPQSIDEYEAGSLGMLSAAAGMPAGWAGEADARTVTGLS